MTRLVVDVSVWVSAADACDSFSTVSRTFLAVLARRKTSLVLPAIARLEVACALARRLRDAKSGRLLANRLLESPLIVEQPLDDSLLGTAVGHGTKFFLRAGDAVYAATARRAAGDLVSWDDELIKRSGAVTPETWLATRAGD